MLRKLSLIVLLSLTLPGLALARTRTVEMNDPVTVNLDTKATAAQIKKGVKMAVLNRKWNISDEKATKAGTEFDAESHQAWGHPWSAKVHVSVSGKTVTIKYVSSEALDAEGKQIHPTYNKIVGYLQSDIPIYVEREVTASQ